MSHLNSHTHCQVAQADTQTKTWQRVCLFQRSTDRQSTRKTEGQHPTKCICHKGFRRYSSIVARLNLRVGGQERSPQSLTAHTLDRCG